MAVRVGVNGFGRIGRLVLRAALEAKRKDIVFVAVNDLGSAEANAHLLAHDSVHGPFPGKVSATRNAIKVGGQNDEVATRHLDAMNKLAAVKPWKLSFSYGRALQAAPLKAWAGDAEKTAVAQAALMERAKANGAATLGQYA